MSPRDRKSAARKDEPEVEPPIADAGGDGSDPAGSEAHAAPSEGEPQAGAVDQEPVDAALVVAERDGYLDDLQRVTAEFANFRRRTTKRHADVVAQAASRLVTDLLPVLDACEAAANQGVEGIEAVHTQMLGVLCGQGLSVLGAVDEAFDPSCHEAVLAEESEDSDASSPPVVAEVLRTGYAWQGRVLRAAMVKVKS